MWRATLMALGMCMVLLGGEAMILDRVILADNQTDLAQDDPFSVSSPTTYSAYDRFSAYNAAYGLGDRRVLVPPDWAPWGLLSAGALTYLYASALSGDKGGEE